MRKLIVFNQVTLDGYIADINGDMSWLSLPKNRMTTKSGQFTGASKSRGSC
jgi:dihydrofolate reductase